MKSLKLLTILVITNSLLCSNVHTYSTNSPTGSMTEEELYASLEAYVASLPPSSRINRNDQKQVVHTQETRQELLAQNFGVFAGGSAHVNEEEQEEENSDEEDSDNSDSEDDDDSDEEKYSKKQSERKTRTQLKLFTLKSDLNEYIHKQENNIFECKLCNRQFNDRGNCRRHVQGHSDEKKFECETCGKKFTKNPNLQAHKISHSKDAKFACEFCPKRFTRKESLKRHIRTHTGKKPFKCPHCPQRFAVKHNMPRHIRNNHKDVITRS